MPTVQVTSATSELLQDVANTLWKARKVVVVTGAGISTNSGIPDFRSENGLYSLIQAQFERAAANPSQETPGDESNDFEMSDRPTKRRRVSVDPESSVAESNDQEHLPHDNIDKTDDQPPLPKDEPAIGIEGFRLRIDGNAALKQDMESPSNRLQLLEARPPFPRHLTQRSIRSSSTSQDSIFSGPQSSTSTQTEDSTDPSAKGLQDRPNASSTPHRKMLLGETVVSSPLSSPPPVLFDPYENTAQSTQESSRSSSECSDSSDTEDTQQSLDFLSSQTSNPSLRNMKGRDLFDSNIWADPLKTSVFYRFATSLRQKVREVQPTTTHHFIAQLRDVGKLARVYTQNIDEIEKKIGLSTDLRNGAGNKRRKSAKQQPLIESEKDGKENIDQLKLEDDSTINGKVDASQPASQASEDAERAKSRPSLAPDKGVECVFLHGSLHSLRCFVCGKLCDWDEDDRESRTLSGEQPECPHCAGATAARQEKGKRALGVGKLRPDIVLYGEEHPQSDLISPIVQYDLSAGPDLLLVLGTSLRVHGLKVMVKEFAKAVHNKGGKVIFINFTKPSESVWGDVIDYWIEWDCDAWVTDLKDRKPHLWLSQEEIQEQEKQKRETLAERRRGNLLKRENSLLGEKRRQTIEPSKPRVPPKNPSAMRNDYACGAYVVYDIFQSLAKIGDRPFDNLGYTPPPTIMPEPPPSTQKTPYPVVDEIKEEKTVITAPAVKAKRPRNRKSAPAILKSRGTSQSDGRPAVKARYKFTTCVKSRTPIPPPVIPQLLPMSRPLPPKPQSRPPPPPPPVPVPAPAPSLSLVTPPPPPPLQKEEESNTTTPSQDPSTSICAAVKTHPRRRKRKEIFEGQIVRPTPKSRRPTPQQQSASRIPAPIPPIPSNNASNTVSSHQTNHELAAGNGNGYISPQDDIITLAPIRPLPGPVSIPENTNPSLMMTPPIKCLEPNPNVSPPSPLAYSAPATIARPQPRPFTFPYPYPSHPMLYSDPLVHLQYGTRASTPVGADNISRDLRGPKIGAVARRFPVHGNGNVSGTINGIGNGGNGGGNGGASNKDGTPSPSDQLQREHWEAAASLMSLVGAPQQRGEEEKYL